MEPLTALSVAAALLVTILISAGFSLANLKMFQRVTGNLGTRVGLRQLGLQRAPIPPLLLTSPLPDHLPARPDPFGGLEPDRLQGVLLRKMIELEQITQRDLQRG